MSTLPALRRCVECGESGPRWCPHCHIFGIRAILNRARCPVPEPAHATARTEEEWIEAHCHEWEREE